MGVHRQNRLLICLGANIPEREDAVARAALEVAALGDIVADSGGYLTPPEGTPENARPYWNRLLELDTSIATAEVSRRLKEYETGVRRGHYGTDVAIDIDVVADSSGVLRPKDYASAYFKAGLYLIRNK